MSGVVTQLKELSEKKDIGSGNIRIGQIVQITENGQAIVDFPGNLSGPVKARSVVIMPPTKTRPVSGLKVLLVFENNDSSLPIIIGLVHDEFCPIERDDPVVAKVEKTKDILIDGEKIVFDAKREIVLRCGKSTLTIRRDGKIVIKGTQLLSRASGTNKIRGSNVSIN